MVARPLLPALLLALAVWSAQAADVPDRLGPSPRDLCPVCGMVVSRYPAWAATVRYKDGHAHHFDGAKDLFKYLFDLKKYAPGRRSEEIATIAVTEYYGVARVDATRAYYVIGSDTRGPMGDELVPLASRAEAEEFMRDHQGRRILSWQEITRELVYRLDDGRFDSKP